MLSRKRLLVDLLEPHTLLRKYIDAFEHWD